MEIVSEHHAKSEISSPTKIHRNSQNYDEEANDGRPGTNRSSHKSHHSVHIDTNLDNEKSSQGPSTAGRGERQPLQNFSKMSDFMKPTKIEEQLHESTSFYDRKIG